MLWLTILLLRTPPDLPDDTETCRKHTTLPLDRSAGSVVFLQASLGLRSSFTQNVPRRTRPGLPGRFCLAFSKTNSKLSFQNKSGKLYIAVHLSRYDLKAAFFSVEPYVFFLVDGCH